MNVSSGARTQPSPHAERQSSRPRYPGMYAMKGSPSSDQLHNSFKVDSRVHIPIANADAAFQ